MKLSSVNKILIGLLFVFSVILIPTSAVKADTFQAYNPNNPSDWGITVEVGLAFSDTGYSTSDPTGKDKYITASGSFTCEWDCWGTFLLARINGSTGDTPLTEGDSPTYYTGVKTLNYYQYGGNTLTAPIFYNPGWNTVAFSGQIGSGGMEPRLIDYVMFFNYVPEVIAPTVTVTASPMTVNYGNGSIVTWESSAGVTSCTLNRSDTGATVRGLASSDFYLTGNLYETTTFTVTCTTDMAAYCSGTYKDLTTKVDWNGVAPFPWVEGTIGRYGDECNSCSDAGNTGYMVTGAEGVSGWSGSTYVTETSWLSNFCAENRFITCLGVRWSNTNNYVRSAYATNSCSGLSQSSCASHSTCTWNP